MLKTTPKLHRASVPTIKEAGGGPRSHPGVYNVLYDAAGLAEPLRDVGKEGRQYEHQIPGAVASFSARLEKLEG